MKKIGHLFDIIGLASGYALVIIMFAIAAAALWSVR